MLTTALDFTYAVTLLTCPADAPALYVAQLLGAEFGQTDRDAMAAAAAAAGNGSLWIILATVCVLLVGAAGSQLASALAFAPFAPQAQHSSRPAGGSSVRHDGSSRHIEGMMRRKRRRWWGRERRPGQGRRGRR